jgi:exopolyphosphatase / guanosine-5'-triphosphate,3'-diphosphate pyrophosphatase
MRYGVIDIGSNTIKFLAAEKDGLAVKILCEESHTTRLAEDLIATTELKPEALARTALVFRELRLKGEALGIDQWRAVATSAVRDASNRKSFLKAAKEALGFPVMVLTGEEEAETIFLGVISDPVLSGRDLFAIDVGGGSAEWIQGQGARIEKRLSLPLGCVRLRERFITGYPVSEPQKQHMRDALREQLVPALADFILADRRLIGTGGTMTSVAGILQELPQFATEKIHHYLIPRLTLEAKWHQLAAMTLAQLQDTIGLPKKRADIIVPGLSVILASMELLGAKDILVSVRGLRYGVLEQLLRA